MTYAVGDLVQVSVPMSRIKKAQWVAGAVSMVDAERVEVTFQGGSRQRFPLDTDRIRLAEGRKEGELWAF